MAKKKTAAELKQEGVRLAEQLAQARKKQVNFAFSIGKDSLILETDLKKKPDVLWRNAKKAGGGPKGAKGQMNVKGRLVELTCDDDDVPTQLPKLAKKFFAERGVACKIMLITPSGSVADEDEPEAEQEAKPARTAASEPAEEPAKPTTPPPQTQEAPVETKAQPAEAPPAAEDRSAELYNILKSEFDALQPKLEQAKTSVNKGAAKKAEYLSKVFVTEIENDVKKSQGVLSLLTKTVGDAIAFGIADGSASSAAAGNSGRKSRLAELERKLDNMLAEFA